MIQPIPSWPNLRPHNEAWEQAKRELGTGDVRAIARRAQEILTRASMPAESQQEQDRR